MRRVLIGILTALSLAQAYSQADTTISLSDLAAPNAPGFALLDLSPTLIERPTTPKAFTLGVLNSFENGGQLPSNFAVEVTPFWYFSQEGLNAQKFLGYRVDEDNQIRQNPFYGLRTAAVSAAFVNPTPGDGQPNIRNFSVGLRANLISIRSKNHLESVDRLVEASSAYLKYLNATRPTPPAAVPPGATAQRRARYTADSTRYASWRADPDGFMKQNARAYPMAVDSVRQLMTRRPIFGVDLAVAQATAFTSDQFSSGEFGRFGLWLTANWAQPLDKQFNSYVNLYAVARYVRQGGLEALGNPADRDLYDFGSKLELEFRNLRIAYEYIYRTIADVDQNTHRSTGILQYKLSPKLYLTGSFGNNFGEQNDLISLLGLNWGFATGKEQLDPTDTTPVD